MRRLIGDGLAEIPWYEAEPERLEREVLAMRRVAPDLTWDPVVGEGGGWAGELPLWPFARPQPARLHEAVTKGLGVSIKLRQSHPAVEPGIVPRDPEPSIAYRTMHSWHLRGDGSLCLLQVASDWSGREPVADLATKAAGWHLEYLLMDTGIVQRMTLGGIASSRKYDAFIARYITRRLEGAA